MKSLVHTEELYSRSVPLEHAPGAKPLVCVGLKYNSTAVVSIRELQKKKKKEKIALDSKIPFHMLWFNFILGLNFISFCF